MSRLGAVVVGRNEALRLHRCLSSVLQRAAPIVFVDSASTDGSADLARAAGVHVIEPGHFTIGRARNAGVEQLLRLDPEVEFIQFVDADAELVDTWFEPALHEMTDHPDVAVVSGRLSERDPERSVYTRLYGIDWDPRVDWSDRCGGIAMMRAAAFRQVGGFNETMRALEDHEICFRLRQAGWGIRRLAVHMAIHDARMSRFTEWWQRYMRGGYSWAQQLVLHGRSRERYGVRQCRSMWFWGLLLPALVLIAAWPTGGASALLLAGYPVQFYRIYRRMRGRGLLAADAALYAASCVLIKFPQALGMMRFHLDQLRLWLPTPRPPLRPPAR